MALEIEEQKLLELTEALEFLQLHSKVCIAKVSGEEGRQMHARAYTVGKGKVHWHTGFFCGFVGVLFPFGLGSLASYLM